MKYKTDCSFEPESAMLAENLMAISEKLREVQRALERLRQSGWGTARRVVRNALPEVAAAMESTGIGLVPAGAGILQQTGGWNR